MIEQLIASIVILLAGLGWIILYSIKELKAKTETIVGLRADLKKLQLLYRVASKDHC